MLYLIFFLLSVKVGGAYKAPINIRKSLVGSQRGRESSTNNAEIPFCIVFFGKITVKPRNSGFERTKHSCSLLLKFVIAIKKTKEKMPIDLGKTC